METGDQNVKLTVILIEDSLTDARAAREMIAEGSNGGFVVEHMELLSTGLERLSKGGVDLILLDLTLPDSRGMETFIRTYSCAGQVPIVVLSGTLDESVAIEAVRQGAQDYLVKSQMNGHLLVRAMRYAIERKRFRDREISYLRQIEEEKKRADELLHIILPDDVAQELKKTNTVKPRRFEHVGVLFCDVVGFTAYCNQHRPGEILGHLQSLVEALESLASEHELEKIKTVGDSFMATAGLLTPLANPALKCVRCGLAMAAAATALPPQWQVRVGVHVGPVIAGIVGRKKYQYDIWGDTVNTAVQMQRAAAPGAVCVNGETWKLLSEDCRGQSQGVIQIKGKADQEIFRVDEVRAVG